MVRNYFLSIVSTIPCRNEDKFIGKCLDSIIAQEFPKDKREWKIVNALKRCGDASRLPFEDGSFDIIMQFTVFTSILDEQMKKTIATEMLRVLKPDGIILWYDYHMNNPKNPDVKGVCHKSYVISQFLYGGTI